MQSVGTTQVSSAHGAPLDGTRSAQKVVIVGGGLAGLTAAKSLIDAGQRVELLESRDVLGGKVSSWRDGDGDWVESGLHVFFGAYREIFELMRELGIYDNVLWKEHVLKYTMAGGDGFEFRTLPLPSPMHLLPAVFGNRYFSIAEKLTLARALPSIVLANDAYYRRQDAYTYEDWHLSHGISHKMLKRMFLPVALALKFLPPEELSAKVVLDVSGIFLRENGASRMGFLNGSPQDKLIGPLADNVRRGGGTIRQGVAVRALIPDTEGRLAAVRLASGEEIHADRFVLALPVHKLNQLVLPEWRQEPYWERLSHFEGVPVMTAQLWLDRQVTGIDNILFSPDGHIPVYADLGNTTPDYAVGGRSRIEAVVAPARPLWNWDDADVVRKVWNDVRSAFPRQSEGAQVVKSTIVRIPQSVYWPKPGLDALRPTQRTPVTNLYLAGGYTIQRFYDSMEGAVSSGRLAARALLDDTGADAQLATSSPRVMVAQP